MVNADREIDRSRELLAISTKIRARTNDIKEQRRREVICSKKLEAEMKWLKFFEYCEPTREFLRRLDEQCIKKNPK